MTEQTKWNRFMYSAFKNLSMTVSDITELLQTEVSEVWLKLWTYLAFS